MMCSASPARKYSLYTCKPELTTGAKGLIQYKCCLGQWLEESCSTGISVAEGVSGLQSRQRTTAVLLQHCWQMWVSTISCATVVLSRGGLSALQLSAKRLFHVLQFDEAKARQGKARQIYLYSTIQTQGNSKAHTNYIKRHNNFI